MVEFIILSKISEESSIAVQDVRIVQLSWRNSIQISIFLLLGLRKLWNQLLKISMH